MQDLDPPELIQLKFGEDAVSRQATRDGITTLWVSAANIVGILSHLKKEISKPYLFLYDLTAIDERPRKKESDYSDNSLLS